MRKLTEIHGEEAMDLIALLVDIGRRVMSDKGIKKYLTGDLPKGVSAQQFSDEFTGEFFVCLFERHRDDCIEMLSRVEGTSRNEYLENSDPLKITADLGTLMEDPVFRELFFASVQSRMSGSASADTRGQS